MLRRAIERTVLVLALTSLGACKAGLPPAPAGADPADVSGPPEVWTAPPSPFEGSAFEAAQLDTQDPHAGHKGHAAHGSRKPQPKQREPDAAMSDEDHAGHQGHTP